MGAAASSSSGVPAARAGRRLPTPPPQPPSAPSEYTLRALEWQQKFITFAQRAYTLAALEGRTREGQLPP
ncbi:unnamed protein product [Aureobasidium mustum]|uniref:Uncharacterized protein n=1 Tax=Aureobasidium mustum TaxID=2773714 RepID=A0A9N8JLN7_9PEZI|nr:unnamed protein product [Aureobasidium mustum]